MTGNATPADRAQLLAARAATEWARGDAVTSRALADRALEVARDGGDDSATASAWVSQALVEALDGDRNANRRAYGQALVHAERAGDVLTLVRVHNNLGSLENEEGRFESALGHLDQALAHGAELWEQGATSPVLTLAAINRSESLLALGRTDEALAELEPARQRARDSGSPLLSYAVLGVGDTNRARGNATQAAAAYREAVAIAERTGDAQILVPALAGLARTTVAEDLGEAQGLAKQALAQPAALGQVAALLAGGWVALAAGEEQSAVELARRAAREAGRRHEAHGLAEALELRALAEPDERSPDLLEEAATLWIGTGHAIGRTTNDVLRARQAADHPAEQAARHALRTLGVRDDANRIAGPLQVIGRHDPDRVEVRTLGTFGVFRGGEPVPASAWQSRKTRDVLKMLAARRGRAVAREVLAEHLWPDTGDPGNRLSVVLSTLRGVLDPGRRHPSDHFVVADRQAVRLDPRHVEVDASVFSDVATAALAGGATADLERAAAMYAGHFLEDDPYGTWAEEVRDELLALSLDVRRRLAEVLAVGDEPDRAVPWLVGLVSDDPYDEPSHEHLLRALHRARRHGELRRAHRTYRLRMAEIDAPARPLEAMLSD